MPILSTDIKLMASERLTDNPDGGGRMTGTEVVDGAVNNLFPDISRLDRVYGRVNLRKAFLFVDTANVDTYYGAHTIIEDAPDDPNVGVLLFSTESHTDERANARDRIESYVTQGPEAAFTPLGDQLTGQRTILVYQRETNRLPEIGEVYVLSIEDAGHPDNGEQQYVRVQDVSHELRTFTIDTGGGNFLDFERRVVSLSLSTELRRDFPGAPASPAGDTGSTVVRSTQVANAAKYYGISPLAQAVTNGDVVLPVADVFYPIVPATQGETPQVDVQAGVTVVHDETSGTETVEVADISHTASTEVTIQNRGLVWVKNLQPLPAPGTATVEFRALGEWYRIQDRGDGKLTGDGTGTVDYATGSVTATLAAMPDVDTSLLWYWGTPAHYTDRSGSAQVEVPAVTLTPDQDMAPASLTVTWTSGGVPKTATDDGKGALTGDGTGHVIYSGSERVVWLQPTSLPDASTQYQLDYDAGAATRETYTPTASGGVISLTAASPPITPGTVSIRVPVQRLANTSARYTNEQTRYKTITDDGLGGLQWADGGALASGSVDYTTGAISFDPRESYERREYI